MFCLYACLFSDAKVADGRCIASRYEPGVAWPTFSPRIMADTTCSGITRCSMVLASSPTPDSQAARRWHNPHGEKSVRKRQMQPTR